jgi:acyl carrier protein
MPEDFLAFVTRHLDAAPPAGLETRLADLNLDSLDLLDFVMAVEKEYDVVAEVDMLDLGMTLREVHRRLDIGSR